VNKFLLTRVQHGFNNFLLKKVYANCLANLNEAEHNSLTDISVRIAHLLCQSFAKGQKMLNLNTRNLAIVSFSLIYGLYLMLSHP
jgi:hypothetical protein